MASRPATSGTSARFAMRSRSPRRATRPGGGALGRQPRRLQADRLGFLVRTREEHGDLVAFDSRTAIVHGPALVAEVLKDREGAFEIRENFLQERLSVAAAEDVFSSRALLNPGLRPAAVVGMGTAVMELAHRRLSSRAAAGVDFDPLPVLEDVISSAVALHFLDRTARSCPDRPVPCSMR